MMRQWMKVWWQTLLHPAVSWHRDKDAVVSSAICRQYLRPPFLLKRCRWRHFITSIKKNVLGLKKVVENRFFHIKTVISFISSEHILRWFIVSGKGKRMGPRPSFPTISKRLPHHLWNLPTPFRRSYLNDFAIYGLCLHLCDGFPPFLPRPFPPFLSVKTGRCLCTAHLPTMDRPLHIWT